VHSQTPAKMIASAVFAVALCCQPPAPREPDLPADALSIYLAQDESAPGLVPRRKVDSDDVIYTQPTPVLTAADIAHCSLDRQQSRVLTLWVVFTPAGAERLKQVSHNHSGKTLAFVTHDQLLVAARIDTEIADGTALLFGAGIESQVRQLYDELPHASGGSPNPSLQRTSPGPSPGFGR